MSRRDTMSDGEPTDAAERLSAFWERVVGAERPRLDALRDPRALVRAVQDVRALPVLEAALSERPEGRLLAADLSRRTALGLRLASTGVCVLDVPEVPADYSLGRSKQTLRRKVRAAAKAGVTWREVTDVAEQAALVRRLDAHLPQKRDRRYRQVDSDHSHMVGSGLWAVAEDAEGTPLVLSVTPHDGRWAQLRLFMALGEGPRFSDARYLLTQAVVETLSTRGVRHLFDGRSPHELTNGLRHFQRMLGFTIVRVRLSRTEAPVRSLPVPRAETPSARGAALQHAS